MTWIIARYDGHCAECEEDIEEGDTISYEKYETYCIECGKDVETQEPPD